MINTINRIGRLSPKTKAILNSINENVSLAALAGKAKKLKFIVTINKKNVIRRAAL
jgi:hypothetical protein